MGGLTRALHRSDRIIFHPFLSSQCSLDQAKRLLESTELNISQVAARVGFSTSQHFPRVFRKHTGLSPARYRLQEWAQKTQTEKS
jgi:AraC-like DNA-binding protein